MTTLPNDDAVGPYELTPEEGWARFDEQARRYLGMSGEDFLCAWDAGEIDPDDPDRHLAIMNVVFLLPLVRRVELHS